MQASIVTVKINMVCGYDGVLRSHPLPSDKMPALRNRNMSYLTYIIFIFFLLLTGQPVLQALPDSSAHRIPVLVAIEKALNEGRLPDAEQLLTSVRPAQLSDVAALWHAVLSARLVHDNGDPPAALSALNALLPRLRSQPEYVEVMAESYIERARMLRTLFWFNPYHRVTDTAGMIIRHARLPEHLKARYHIHRAMYLTMMLLHFKAEPDLDSMNALIARAPADLKYLYQPDLAVSVIINYGRNADRDLAIRLRDSLWRTIVLPETSKGAHDRIAMWRAVANAFMDEIAFDQTPPYERQRKGLKVLRCFDRALAIQEQKYPGSMVDRVTLLDLKSLALTRMRRHGAALDTLRSSERILRSVKYHDPGYYYLHFMTANYTLQVLDSALSGRPLYNAHLRALDKWEWLEARWGQWEDQNTDSLGHYRFYYTMDPGAIVAMICYNLNRQVPDPDLLDRAFAGQERAKYRRMRRHWKRHFGIQEPKILTLRELQKGLSPDAAILSATDAGIYVHSTHVLVITSDTIAFVRLHDTGHRISWSTVTENQTEAFRNLQSFKQSHHELWKMVFEPLYPLIRDKSRLTVWPSGYLSGFSMELLVPDTTGFRDFKSLPMMRDRHRFHFDHSWTISQMRRMLPRAASTERKIFVPDYTGTSMYRLRFFEQMASELSKRYGFKVFDGAEASVDRFLREAPSAGIIQIAAHGYSDRLVPGEQYVYMDSVSTAGSTRLSAYQLIQTDLKAEMAVLSICMGGIAEWSHQNPRNLAYWFSQSGVHTCIYSHWKVDDRSTARVLERFYDYLKQGVWRYEALRKAQDDLRREARIDEELNPVYWAGLTIIGEDGPVDMERSGRHYMWSIVVVMMVIMAWGGYHWTRRVRNK